MQPTLNPSLPSSSSSSSFSSSSSSPSPPDVVLVWKVAPSPSLSSFPHGSVVVVRSPYNPTRLLIKRLVGKEGDVVYTADSAKREAEEGRVGRLEQIDRGRMWVEGENEQRSAEDSRQYGPFPAGLLQGRAIAIVWPPSRIQWLRPTLDHVGGEQRIRNRLISQIQ